MKKIITSAIAILVSLMTPSIAAPPSAPIPIEPIIYIEVPVEVPVEVTLPIGDVKKYAYNLIVERWNEDQWPYFDDLIQNKESGWNHLAQNPGSTAFGIGQFLDDTWHTVGCVKTEDALIQVDCTLEYIATKYSTPQAALAFWIAQATDPLHPVDGWY